MAENNLENIDVEKPYKGLHTDNHPSEQPEGTYRYGLNAVDESLEGVLTERSNEAGSRIGTSFGSNLTIIGEKYIEDNKNLLVLTYDSKVFDGNLTVFGILEDSTEVPGEVSKFTELIRTTVLNTHKENPLDIEYRKSKNQRVFYFTDNGRNNARSVNIDQLNNYYNSAYETYLDGGGDPDTYAFEKYDANSFELIKSYVDIPYLSFAATILENGGSIDPGSYNFSIRYLDENQNPTEWITTTNTINMFNDNTSATYSRIRGSRNTQNDVQNFPKINKSIKIRIFGLDVTFPYYQMAVISATGGTGKVTKVVAAPIQSTRGIVNFVYDGNESGYTDLSLAEILVKKAQIKKPKHIEQIENRLVLANGEGSPYNWCDFQKYASKVQSRLVTEAQKINDVLYPGSPKNPNSTYNFCGYMPGEAYSFGIVYIMSDMSESPAFHVPGRAGSTTGTGMGYYECASLYPKLHECYDDYWGTDSEGNILEGNNIRHHRFPFRTEANKPLVTYGPGGTSDVTTELFGIAFDNVQKPHPDVVGFYIVRNERLEDDKLIFDNALIMQSAGGRGFEGAEPYYRGFSQWIPLNVRNNDDGYFTMDPRSLCFFSPEHQFLNKQKSFTDIHIEGIVDYNRPIPPAPGEDAPGINFPDFIDKNLLADPDDIGNNRAKMIQDVQPGTSYNQEYHKKKDKDNDGFDLSIGWTNRTTNMKFTPSPFFFPPVSDTMYLNAASYRIVSNKSYYNTSCDNKMGIMRFNSDYMTDDEYNQFILPDAPPVGGGSPRYVRRALYGSLINNTPNLYSDFLTRPYYKEYVDYTRFGNLNTINNTRVFNGDAYVGSMNLNTTMYQDTQIGDFAKKSRVWQIVLGAVLIVVGIVLAVYSGGTSGILVGLGVATIAGLAISYGVSLAVSGIKFEQMKSMIDVDYPNGLYNEVVYNFGLISCNHLPYKDDTFIWYADRLTDMYFESSVNIGLRPGATSSITDFVDSPNGFTKQEYEDYLVEKLTVIDKDQGSGRLYKGYPTAEFYDCNLDFLRKNKEQVFYHLPAEYNCCSNQEVFETRVWYSEQSFQEEITDNYRVFLPNSYKDIEGQYGAITDLFRQNRNLYIHTKEALWKITPNEQERVTGDLVSFLGTGAFLSIPPILIGKNEIGNFGSKHKMATVETPYGVVFVNETNGKIYLFNEGQIQDLSSPEKGNSTWFKNNIPMRIGIDNSAIKLDAPTNIAGYHSCYDSKLDRVLITKKDYQLLAQYEDDFEIVDGPDNLYEGLYDHTKTLFYLRITGSYVYFELGGDPVYINMEDTTIPGELKGSDYFINKSWTMSYSFKNGGSWIGWHSYLPNIYVSGQNQLYSFKRSLINTLTNVVYIWKHDSLTTKRHNFYNTQYPHILDLVYKSPLQSENIEDLSVICSVRRFVPLASDNLHTSGQINFIQVSDKFFDELQVWNSKQHSGILTLLPKNQEGDIAGDDFMWQSVRDRTNEALVENKETTWHINNFRDYVVNYAIPMFTDDWSIIKSSFPIDKVLSAGIIDFTKFWTDAGVLKDKYVIARFILKDFAGGQNNTIFTTNYILERNTVSQR